MKKETKRYMLIEFAGCEERVLNSKEEYQELLDTINKHNNRKNKTYVFGNVSCTKKDGKYYVIVRKYHKLTDKMGITELDNMTTEAQRAEEIAALQSLLDEQKITQADFDAQKEQLESMLCVEELSAKILAAGKNPDEFIYTVADGKYETKAELEANGFSCVILKKPEVTKADAYASAFAITTDCDEENYERAMEIIYAINTDSYLRNMLQFGVKNTNYYLDENNFVTFATGESEYIMDLKYTGDLFLSYFVEGVYTPDTKFYGEKQNLEASYTPVQ